MVLNGIFWYLVDEKLDSPNYSQMPVNFFGFALFLRLSCVRWADDEPLAALPSLGALARCARLIAPRMHAYMPSHPNRGGADHRR